MSAVAVDHVHVNRTPSVGELLDPRHEAVPFHGREAELDRLRQWRDDGSTWSVLLLHGPAGAGKTRLTREFAARSAERGWVVRHDGGPEGDRALVVIDDADRWPWSCLFQLLQEPMTAQASRTRVLLTSRTTGWWWSALRQRAGDLDYTAGDLALPAAPEDPGFSFATAREHFAAALGLAEPTGRAPAAGTPFDLHLAALAAVHGADAHAGSQELVRWLMSVDPAPPRQGRLAEDVLAVTLLDERIAPERSPDALETLLRAAERWPHARRRAEILFTTEPDLALTASSATLIALAQSPVPARAVARHVFHDERFHCDPLPAVLTRALLRDREPHADRLELAELHRMLSARAALAALREEAVEASQREVALYRELVEEDPREHRGALADAVGDLGLRLVAVGRAQDALAAAEEAVELCHQVAEDDQDSTPQLAAALEQLSARYAAVGRREDALTALTRASVLYQQLAKHTPTRFRLDFAKATHHLAVRLFEVDRKQEGLSAADAAVRRWRKVAKADPRYEPEHARTLVAIAALLSGFGQRERARSVLREAIGVLRRLAAANPAAFEPELAEALEALGAVLLRSERMGEALKVSREAVEVRRELAADGDPGAQARLATSLVALVDALPEPADRIATAEEAVRLLRPLGLALPVRHRVDLAIAQARLARLLLGAGREYEAGTLVEEVLSVERRLPRQLLVACGGRLAGALHALADGLAEIEHHGWALRLAEQVVDIWRDLLGHHRGAPIAFAMAVHQTAVLLRGAEDPEALPRARSALLLWHLTRTPEQLRTELRYADTLSFLARLCAEAGEDLDTALELAHRAVLVLRTARATPDRFIRAVAAADEVVRAHPDPEAARQRMRAMAARDQPRVSSS